MSTINVIVIIDELQRIYNQLDTLRAEYEGKHKGTIYTNKQSLLLERLKAKKSELIGIIKPGAIAQWEITLETKYGVEVQYIAYPGHYDRNDVLRILEAVKFIDKVDMKILDIHRLGIIKLGYLEKLNGFQ